MSEEVNKEFDEMLEDVMGGEPEKANHSPDAPEGAEKSLEAEENAAPEVKETFEPYGEEEYSFADDSAQDEGEAKNKEGAPEKTDSAPEKKEPAPDAEKIALQTQITNYEKRLHDTQSAMHKANEERARLQKELDELRKSKAAPEENEEDGEEDWFKDSGNGKEGTAELESKIKAVEEKQEQYRQEQALHQWQLEAEKVAAEHEDFNSLVYEKLEPLLDEENGDPAVLAAYSRWKDKTPAGAYEFAKKMFAVETPAVKEEKAENTVDPTKGKAGLDRINSAEFAEEKRSHGNMIDEVFG